MEELSSDVKLWCKRNNLVDDSVMASTGSVGIGTTSPYRTLSVSGSGVFTGGDILTSTLTATSTATAANFVASSASATSTFAGGLAIETSGFVYDFSSNKVGIGMSNPTETLHVTGTGRFSGALTLDTALTVANGGTGQTSLSSSQLLYGAGTSAVKSVATTTLSLGTGLSYSGTLGSLVGGASGTLSLSGVAPSSLSLTKGNFIVGDDAGTAQATSTIFISSAGNVLASGRHLPYRLDVDGTARTSDLITSSIVLQAQGGLQHTETSYGGFNSRIHQGFRRQLCRTGEIRHCRWQRY